MDCSNRGRQTTGVFAASKTELAFRPCFCSLPMQFLEASVAQPGRASRCQRECRGFESLRSLHFFTDTSPLNTGFFGFLCDSSFSLSRLQRDELSAIPRTIYHTSAHTNRPHSQPKLCHLCLRSRLRNQQRPAFGEDAPQDLDLRKYHLNAVPSGLRHYAGFWHNALFDGYDFTNDQHPVLGYIISAVVGIVVIAAIVFAIFRIMRVVRRRGSGSDLANGAPA